MIGWPRNAYVGQKVVCIADEGWQCLEVGAPDFAPVSGQVYTISEIDLFRGAVHFALSEFGPSATFHSHGFRPAKDTRAAVEELKRACLHSFVPEGVA
jgi:hypothetical protein